MLAYGNTIYQYNAQGSLTTKISGQDTTFYTYDLMGNLISVKLPNGDFIEYLIDAQNRRIGKVVNGQVVRKWLYEDQLNPIVELDGNDSLLARFIYGSRYHVPDYMVKGDTTYRIISDHLGSVRAVVNVNNGAIMQEISYNEFGMVLQNTNPEFQPFAYAGGLYDMHTRLVRFGARDYDCYTGRWTAKDPIRFGGLSMNLYIYVRANPINFIDINGLSLTQTITHAIQSTLAAGDFARNYLYIQIADEVAKKRGWANYGTTDRYYHCMANCQAAKRGPGGKEAAEKLSNAREERDLKKGAKPENCDLDMMANEHGRNCPPDVSCEDRCSNYHTSYVDRVSEIVRGSW